MPPRSEPGAVCLPAPEVLSSRQGLADFWRLELGEERYLGSSPSRTVVSCRPSQSCKNALNITVSAGETDCHTRRVVEICTHAARSLPTEDLQKDKEPAQNPAQGLIE